MLTRTWEPPPLRDRVCPTAVAELTSPDALQVRTFFATGLVVTVSTALASPGRHTDTMWGAWLLGLVDPAAPPSGT